MAKLDTIKTRVSHFKRGQGFFGSERQRAQKQKGSSVPASTRDIILNATRRTIHDVGLARTTTKLIAQTAGLSEATLFKYFEQKNDLLLAALQHYTIIPIPGSEIAGNGNVRDNFRDCARAALLHYRQVVPAAMAAFADSALLLEHRQWATCRYSGSLDIYCRVNGYVSAEQRLGRIRAEYPSSMITEMLLGSCFRQTFRQFFIGSMSAKLERKFLSELVQTLDHAFVVHSDSNSR